MNAYLDLSYICHVITLLNVPYYFKRIINVHFRKIEVILLGLVSIILYFNAFMYTQYPYLNYLYLLLYYVIIYKKNFLKYYVLFLFIYYGNLATCLLFTRNLYLYHGLIFVNQSQAFFNIFIQFINIIIVEIFTLSIHSIKLLKNYRINISIELNNEIKDLSGYIDSGNTLIYDGLPVIFIKEKYLKTEFSKEMIVEGIGKRNCKYFETNININGNKKRVICASGDDRGFKGCDCLLNITLLEDRI